MGHSQSIIEKEKKNMETQLINRARAALTESPSLTLVKPTYGFVNTAEIIGRFERQGWNLSNAKQVKVRSIEREGYQKHMLKFRNENFQRIDGLQLFNESIPELIIENSHDGTGALKIFFGVFRIACLNGIIAGASMASMRVIHSQNAIKNIDAAIDNMTAGIPDLIERVKRFSTIDLNHEKKIELARIAYGIRLKDTKGAIVTDYSLEKSLLPKRAADCYHDAFSVFNVLQEKVIRGGLIFQQPDKAGRIEWKKSRAINSVSQSVKLNRDLWEALETVTAA